MTDCPLKLIDGCWTCPDCGWRFTRKGVPVQATKPPRRNCPNSPDLAEAREKLGISVDDVAHWAQALARWTRAGFPVRPQAEVERIERDICRPCDQYVDGRCKSCGCRVSKSKIAVVNKLKMATESCPKGKWGESEQPAHQPPDAEPDGNEG